MSDNTQAHEALKKRCLILLSELGYLAMSNSTAVGRSLDGKRFIHSGGKGQSDIFAVQPVTGRFWAVEIKTGTGRLSDKQQIFAGAVTKRGATFIEARSEADVLKRHEMEKLRFNF